MNDDCEGCHVKVWKSDCYHAEIDNCPCRGCLISMICEKPCDKLRTHWGKAIERRTLMSLKSEG